MNTAAELVLLLEKVGVAAMMNLPEYPISDEMYTKMEQLGDDANIIDEYFRSLDDPCLHNIYAVEHGLFEVSKRYFAKRNTKEIFTEIVNAYHGFSRKNPLPVPLIHKCRKSNPPPASGNGGQTAETSIPVTVHNEIQHELQAVINHNNPIDEIMQIDEEPRTLVEQANVHVPPCSPNPFEAIHRTSTVRADVHMPAVSPNVPRNQATNEDDEEWLLQQRRAYEVIDEMRSIVNAPDPNDAIQEHQIAQIDMTERELDFQRMRMEEMFPVPLDIDLRNEGFGEETAEEPLPLVTAIAATANPPAVVQPATEQPSAANDVLSPPQPRLPRRRIRRIAFLDPNYRPPRMARPPLPNDWTLATVNDIRRNLIRIDNERNQAAMESADIMPRNVSSEQTFNAEQNIIELPQPAVTAEDPADRSHPATNSRSVQVTAQNVDHDDVLPNIQRPTLSIPESEFDESSVSIPIVLDNVRQSSPIQAPLQSPSMQQSFHSSPLVQEAPKFRLTHLISPMEEQPGLLQIIENVAISNTSVLNTLCDFGDQRSVERASLIQDIEHRAPCERRSSVNTVLIAKPPYHVQTPNELPGLLIKPKYNVEIEKSTKISSYLQASSKVVDAHSELNAKDLLQLTNDGQSNITPFDTFIAYCDMQNKEYIKIHTENTSLGSLFSSVTLSNCSDSE